MLVPLLMACADDDGMAEAEERIDTALHAHPVGTAVVMAEVGGDGVEGALGGAWHGQDLADWLAVCGTNEATWDVQLVLRAGSWPHTLDDAGEAPSCITQRLTTFPFEEPPAAARKRSSGCGGAPPSRPESSPGRTGTGRCRVRSSPSLRPTTAGRPPGIS